ncbi:MAG TPA: PIN domain-containing protein [Gallionellaceae bacterium]
MWSNCIFAVDANVLLNLYRYSPETRSELERALASIKERLFVPHQAAKEFLTNRISVTAEQAKEYTNVINTIDDLRNTLSNRKRHPFLSEEVLPKFTADADQLVAQLKSQQETLLDRPNNDEILVFVESVSKDRIGNPFNDAELKELAKEGEARYQNGVPPGYKDGKKEAGGDVYRKFGDLIIWKQLIAQAKTTMKPVIFITDDQKDDWWLRHSGKTLGPRTELREEFISLVKQDFWMYTVDRFLEENARIENTTVNQDAISEIINVSHDAQVERAASDEAVALERSRIPPDNELELLGSLSSREIEVLDLLSLGFTNAEIAEFLDVAQPTIRFHINNVLRKLRLNSRDDLKYWLSRYFRG